MRSLKWVTLEKAEQIVEKKSWYVKKIYLNFVYVGVELKKKIKRELKN